MTLSSFEFYIYQPLAATNLLINPSFETTSDYWTPYGGASTRVSTVQRRGACSLQIEPAAGTANGIITEVALTDTLAYTFSVDINTVDGKAYSAYFATTADVAVGTATTWTGNGHWQRRAVTYTASATTDFHLIVACSSDVTSDDLWQIDGAQLETGSTDSSYFDGDMVGFVPGQVDFGWNGTRHESTSWRSGNTRKGGSRVRIKDYLPAITVLGLGMSPVLNQAIPHNLGGSYYQNTIATDRTFSILGELNGSSPGAFLTLRKALVDAVNFRATAVPQPLVMEWRGLDLNGNEAADTCLIECLYSGGLEGNWEQFGYEQIPLQFQSFLPFIASDGDNGANLDNSLAINPADYIVKRSNGVWSNLSTAFTSDNTSSPQAMVKGLDGNIYIGGDFTDAGGNADMDNIVKYNPVTGAITNLTSGTDGTVYALAVAPNGDIYAGGIFDSAAGVANTAAVAKWDGTQWNALSTTAEFTSDDFVEGLAFAGDGTLYIGGTFTDVGDANGDYIVSYTGSSFTSLGAGLDGAVNAVAVAPNGDVYVTGEFDASGATVLNGIGRWDGSAWQPLSTGFTSDGRGEALLIAPNGDVYVTGLFTTAGGVTVNNIARWNGTQWSALGEGINSTGHSLAMDSNGYLYVGGYFTAPGTLTEADRIAMWNGSSWLPIDINLPNQPYVYTILIDDNDDLYVGFNSSGTAYASGIAARNVGSGMAYPSFRVLGPGTLRKIINYTTGRQISFNNLTLQAGEALFIDLNPERPFFWSYFRGNILNYVLPGSNLDFPMVPGDNNIGVQIYPGTDANTAVYMTWKNRYLSLDGAVY